MLTVTETGSHLRAQCRHCGAHTKLPRFRRNATFKRFDRAPASDQWVRCAVCGDLSRLEVPVVTMAAAA